MCVCVGVSRDGNEPMYEADLLVTRRVPELERGPEHAFGRACGVQAVQRLPRWQPSSMLSAIGMATLAAALLAPEAAEAVAISIPGETPWLLGTRPASIGC